MATIKALDMSVIANGPPGTALTRNAFEFFLPSSRRGEGTTFYTHTRVMLEEDYVEKATLAGGGTPGANKSDWNEFWIMKGRSNGNLWRTALFVAIGSNGIPYWRLTQQSPVGSNVSGSPYNNTSVGVPLGKFFDFEVYYRWGINGIFRCWVNGIQIYNYIGRQGKPEEGDYIEHITPMANYRESVWFEGPGAANGPTHTIYSDFAIYDDLPSSRGGSGNLILSTDFTDVTVGPRPNGTHEDSLRSTSFDAQQDGQYFTRFGFIYLAGSRSQWPDYISTEIIDIDDTGGSQTGVTEGSGGDAPTGGGGSENELGTQASFAGTNNQLLTDFDSNWTAVGTDGVRIVSANSSIRPAVSVSYHAAYRNDLSPGSDQYAELQNIVRTTNSSGVGPAICIQSDNSFYFAMPTQDSLDLIRVDAGSPTVLGTTTQADVNSYIKIGKVGDNLVVYDDDTPVITVIDSTYNGGEIGVGAYNNVTGSNGLNWSGGDYNTGAIGTTVSDAFTGSNGTSVDDRTPDTTDIGSTWKTWNVNDVEPDIQGNAVRLRAAGMGIDHDLGYSDMHLTIPFNCGGANNRFEVLMCGNGSIYSSRSGIGVVVQPGLTNILVREVLNGTELLKFNNPVTVDNTTTYSLELWAKAIDTNTVDVRGALDGVQIFSFIMPRYTGTHVLIWETLYTDDALRINSFDKVAPTDWSAIADDNNAPVITSNGGAGSQSVNVTEGQTAVTTITYTEADGDDVVAELSGADSPLLSVNPSTFALTFARAPWYDFPRDGTSDGESGNDSDNVNEVTITLKDEFGAFDNDSIQDLSINIIRATAAWPSGPVISNIASDGFDFKVTPSVVGDVYLVVYSTSASPPDHGQIIDGTDGDDNAADFDDTAECDGINEVTISPSGLTTGVYNWAACAIGDNGEVSYAQGQVTLTGGSLYSATIGPLPNNTSSILPEGTSVSYRLYMGGDVGSPSFGSPDDDSSGSLDEDGQLTVTYTESGSAWIQIYDQTNQWIWSGDITLE